MGDALGWVEGLSIANELRTSRWGYASVNAAHILGISLLVGAVVPLNLRLLGLWAQIPLPALARILVPTAAGGLALAACAGALLFSVRAQEYAGLEIFQAKLLLIGLATASAVYLHLREGLLLAEGSPSRQRVHAAISLACWLAALVCGRFIGFSMP